MTPNIPNIKEAITLLKSIPQEKFCCARVIQEDGRMCPIGHIAANLDPESKLKSGFTEHAYHTVRNYTGISNVSIFQINDKFYDEAHIPGKPPPDVSANVSGVIEYLEGVVNGTITPDG